MVLETHIIYEYEGKLLSLVLGSGGNLEVKVSSLICGCLKSEPQGFIWIFNSGRCPKHTIINGITRMYNDEV